MKLNTSRTLIWGITVIFTAFVVFKFGTIQWMDTSDENYFLYNIEGEELFSINNDGNNTIVEIEDKEKVTLKGFFEQGESGYKVLPYSFIDINSSKGSLTYQFLADNSKKSFSYPVRFRKFELIGGTKFGYIKSLARLNKSDKPLLMIFPKEGKPIFGKTNDGIRGLALQEGLIYIDKKGISKELPMFEGNVHDMEKSLKEGTLNLIELEKDGVVSSVNGKLVLNLSISDGVISKKDKKRGGYKEVKTKYLNITEFSNFANISKLVLSHASRAFYIQKENNISYLNAPYEIPIDKKIVVKGKNSLFGFSKYLFNADFTTKVPRLDKPKIQAVESKSSRYYDYLDIDNMYGLYVSDEKAKVFYSKDGKRWIKAIENYKYAPPRYLYEAKAKGQFIAPKSFKRIDGKMYYKIVSSLSKYDIAFNGKIKIGSNPVQNTTHRELITVHQRETVMEAEKGKLEECGILFRLERKRALKYSFSDKVEREFEIVKRDDGYEYRIKESLNPFKSYKIFVKGYKDFEYTPQLSCKYRAKKRPKEILSLYNEKNFLNLIPNAPSREAKKVVLEESKTSSQKGVTSVPKELIPIYGDGARFGLLANGVKMDELTIDRDFSLKVADIYTKKIQPLLNNKELQKKLKNKGEIIEGATVVLKIDKEGKREILSLFSYPYPQNSNIERELIVDSLNNQKSTIQNRALDMLVHPGSTFKIVTAIALSQEGKLNDFTPLKNKQDIYGTPFANGTIKFHLKNYSDSSGTESTQHTDFLNSFSHSYNTYFGYAGLTLHKRLSRRYRDNLFPVMLNDAQREDEFVLSKVAKELYFNRKIPLSQKPKIYARASQFPTIFTSPKEVADSAIGQYEVYSTPLQMAIVTSVIYDNKLQLPTIVKNSKSKIENKDMTQERDKSLLTEFISIFRSEESFEIIQDAMEKVIVEGTAKKTFKSFKSDKCTIYGKTGTAQKGKKELYDGWFVSFTKGLKEDIVIATVVRNSGTGATYSAPINRKIIEAWMKREEGE